MSGRQRDISKSMVALMLSLAALASLGLSSWVPAWLGRDSRMADVAPGMLTVDPEARGIATLGGGVTAALYDSGLRISHDDAVRSRRTAVARVGVAAGSRHPPRSGAAWRS